MTWSATQYSRFEAERTRPVRDLVAAIPLEHVKAAIDLGCGPGNSTEVLAQRYPSARVSGMDSSEDMVKAAQGRLRDIDFQLADIAEWRAPELLDVILANASLQWVPDHATLYPRLVSQLAEGGCLAVQTPDNLEEPAHFLAREVAASGPWAGKIGQVRVPDRHSADWYYALLKPVCTHVDIWRTTYFHPLEGPQAVVEWFKGTALRPFMAPLDEAERQAFLDEYLRRIAEAYPEMDDGTVLLPFPRLFLMATR